MLAITVRKQWRGRLTALQPDGARTSLRTGNVRPLRQVGPVVPWRCQCLASLGRKTRDPSLQLDSTALWPPPAASALLQGAPTIGTGERPWAKQRQHGEKRLQPRPRPWHSDAPRPGLAMDADLPAAGQWHGRTHWPPRRTIASQQAPQQGLPTRRSPVAVLPMRHDTPAQPLLFVPAHAARHPVQNVHPNLGGAEQSGLAARSRPRLDAQGAIKHHHGWRGKGSSWCSSAARTQKGVQHVRDRPCSEREAARVGCRVH
mmetsp:Transcript_16501/g.50244  ORF Transcript_16501/g.50244 Transcript_16501/m.50244 type:complete len:259 (-) Transcript_16501:541-1317(-)